MAARPGKHKPPENMSLSEMLQEAVAAKGGNALSDKEVAEIKEIHESWRRQEGLGESRG